jgi:lipid-binding SYLF domain-containing protein
MLDLTPIISRRLAMRKITALFSALLLIGLPAATMAADKDKVEDRVENCGTVLKEIMDIPEDIPPDLVDKAECVIVYPSVLKAAFVIGGSYGRGAMTCRTGEHFTGPWGAPTMMALEGGSVGFQIGGQATDFVLLVMNPRGARAILNSKVKLGADASAAAGPKGRDASASTDATLRAEILSYSRARGLFAGVSLEGSTVRPDNDANEKLYGKKVTAAEIVFKGAVAVPPSAQKMVGYLNQKSPKNLSDPASLRE